MRPLRALKRLGRMVFRRHGVRLFGMPRSKFDYLAEVGDGTGSSTVMAPLLWILRTFPEAPPMLWEKLDDGQEKPIRDHDILRLLERPNPHYSGAILWMATLLDWHVDGNGYWLKIRSGSGLVKELWWAPHWLIEPKGDSDNYVAYYEYRPGAGAPAIPIRPEDVVHFRFGLDPEDTRKGYAPLKSVLREVFTDDEAANFTAQILRNMGVPGLIVSPENNAEPNEEDVKATKAYFAESFSGDKRGEPLVMSGPTKVEQFGFSPEELLLKELRRIPEERVSAVLGVPAIVAGLGAGLDRSTFTNMAEAREAAYEAGIIPSQRILAEDVRFQLLPDFEDDPFAWRFGFDLAKVRVLQEDLYRQAMRHAVGVREGCETVSEWRRGMGLDVDESHQIFLRQANVVEVPANGGDPRPLAPSRNGNGSAQGVDAREIAEEVVRALDRAELAKPTPGANA